MQPNERMLTLENPSGFHSIIPKILVIVSLEIIFKTYVISLNISIPGKSCKLASKELIQDGRGRALLSYIDFLPSQLYFLPDIRSQPLPVLCIYDPPTSFLCYYYYGG